MRKLTSTLVFSISVLLLTSECSSFLNSNLFKCTRYLLLTVGGYINYFFGWGFWVCFGSLLACACSLSPFPPQIILVDLFMTFSLCHCHVGGFCGSSRGKQRYCSCCVFLSHIFTHVPTSLLAWILKILHLHVAFHTVFFLSLWISVSPLICRLMELSRLSLLLFIYPLPSTLSARVGVYYVCWVTIRWH